MSVIVALLSAVQLASAQVVYSCDFEDAAENAQWVLNSGTRGPLCESKWFIGEAGNFSVDGDSGLFISSDSVHAVYTSKQAMYVVAYREMTLPVGSYYLDFDWRALGNGSSASIVVAWVPQTQATNSNNSGSLAAWANTYKVGNSLFGSRPWSPQRSTITVTNATSQGKLVFIWSAAKDDPHDPSGCVDNITISEATPCNTPTQLNYTENTAMLKWNGNASYYQVRDYCANDGSLVEYDSVATKNFHVDLQSEGTHIFLVRSVCDDGVFSEWVSTSAFSYIPGKRCIEYLDIGGTPRASGVCYTGSFDDFIRNGRQGSIEMVDNGPGSEHSLHTIHTDLNEIDPITTVAGGLSTVPDGEIASVRLGAYDGSGKSARIEYKYTVQAGMSDLLDLKYAVVMQSGNHGSSLEDGDMNPTFTLNILDGRGNQLDGCTQQYFVAGFGDQSNWHQENDWYWCNWAKVTVSLRQYIGQTLTIRLTAARCSYDTHPAHAYFTIGCRGGALEGLACGDFATDHFTAPEGFTYRWYKEGEPQTTLSTEQTFQIPPLDANIYMVECHSLTDPSCYYALTANPNPRYPMAQVNYTSTIDACQNIVDFSNSSFVRVVNRATGETMSEGDPIYDIFYHYGDGVEEWVEGTAHRHIYPSEGGTFECYAVASMNDGICQDTIRYTITLPDILHTGTQDTIHSCVGDSVQLLSEEWVYRDTVYSTFEANRYGCDAPYDHYVFFHPVSYDSTVVEMCEGGYVDFEGARYFETGTYIVNLRTVHGCDSVLALKLTVIPQLEIEAPDTVEICADDSLIGIRYDVIKGRVNAVHVTPDSLGLMRGFAADYPFSADDFVLIPVPRNLHPGYYRFTLSLGTPDCPADPVDVVVKVKYSSAIIAQKNDLIALLNDDYNGGYTFTGYQWYRNGELMPGQNTSYLVVSDADRNAEYWCMLVGTDGLLMETCPVIYTSARTALDDISTFTAAPTAVVPGGRITLSHGGLIRIYDALGRLVSTEHTPAYGPVQITAPAQQGVYLVTAGSDALRITVN